MKTNLCVIAPPESGGTASWCLCGASVQSAIGCRHFVPGGSSRECFFALAAEGDGCPETPVCNSRIARLAAGVGIKVSDTLEENIPLFDPQTAETFGESREPDEAPGGEDGA